MGGLGGAKGRGNDVIILQSQLFFKLQGSYSIPTRPNELQSRKHRGLDKVCKTCVLQCYLICKLHSYM